MSSNNLKVRVSAAQDKVIRAAADRGGFDTLAGFVRYALANYVHDMGIEWPDDLQRGGNRYERTEEWKQKQKQKHEKP